MARFFIHFMFEMYFISTLFKLTDVFNIIVVLVNDNNSDLQSDNGSEWKLV